MHVLDVGCGGGDVSFLAARIVGPTGTVTGIDVHQNRSHWRRSAPRPPGLANVRFLAADAKDFVLDEPVDASSAGWCSMYWPEAASVVRHLAKIRQARRASSRFRTTISRPPSRSRGARNSKRRSIECARLHPRGRRNPDGSEARSRLRRCGAADAENAHRPRASNEGRSRRRTVSSTEITRTLLPLMELTGVATADEVDIDTLASRLKGEALELRATHVAPSLVGAWTRKPQSLG